MLDGIGYLESLWADYRRDPATVRPEWRDYFDALDGSPGENASAVESARLQCLADDLTHAYRVRGHKLAKLDPLGLARSAVDELDPEHYGLTAADLDRPLGLRPTAAESPATLRSVIQRLQETYCRSIGAQFMHIDDLNVRTWLLERMESSGNRIRLTPEMQLRILTRLTDAVLFEEAMRKKHVGAKTFSLEGSETLIPLLDLAIEKAAGQGVVEIVMGMAHRGRLNVLANIIGKPVQDIFWEFSDADAPQYMRGDVRYHLGYSGDWKTVGGNSVHLSLCFNPSHLEFVNPVALGRMRAKLDRTGDDAGKGLVVLIHGDASFAGEGIVQETLNMSELPAYSVGGTLHVIVNNQLGFTTPPAEGRSTEYATAVAKMLQIPIFHVNGEDPEAAAQVVDLALDFRHRYRRDVVIDMYGYRRWGHNEGDEPGFTQPVMYREIEDRETVRDRYLGNLLQARQVTREQADEIQQRRKGAIEAEFQSSKLPEYKPSIQTLSGVWRGYGGGPEPADDAPGTSISGRQLAETLTRLTAMPDDFHLHPKLKRSLKTRRAMAESQQPLDWSAAEAVALGSLAVAGHPVRLMGQDTARGTFSQRHAVLHDYKDGHAWCPLQHLDPDQAAIEICNTPLSEAGALGFEYGYSLDYPEALVMWEAQFGDFANAAQVIIDQFIASAEEKWHRLSGLVLLLPHGYEGQGPEHSSARLERLLMLSANDNWQIVQPTTPAQYFHVLRRQALRRWRKPLAVLTPKSLLRHPEVVSKADTIMEGSFRRVLSEGDEASEADSVRRILICSGKMYYDLLEARRKQQCGDIAIVRLEQLYPLPKDELFAALADYSDAASVVWVQEEPINMGAWQYLRMQLGETLAGRFTWSCLARQAASSPAAGSQRLHKEGQRELIAAALAAPACSHAST